MRFNKHSNFEGAHAFLSPSSWHWVNYDDERLIGAVHSYMAARRGTQLHELAKSLIDLAVKLPDTEQTLNKYVNDCIGFRMTTEQTLWYSPIVFGTADAVSFSQRTNLLRVFDLKTGLTEAKFMQLLIYAALFCLEYDKNPVEIEIELRIYQNDEVELLVPDAHDIIEIMDKTRRFDNLITQRKMEAFS